MQFLGRSRKVRFAPKVRSAFAFAVALSACGALSSTTAAPLSWQLLDAAAQDATARPSPRRGAALAHDPLTSRLIMFGGVGDGGLLNDAWAFHLGNSSWERLVQPSGSAAPEPRHTFVYGLYVNTSGGAATAASPPRRALIVATGQADSRMLSDIWALDLDSATWRRLPDAGDAPSARYGSAGGIAPALPGEPAPTRLWLSHGFSSSTRYSDTRYYDLAAERWVLTHGPINSYSPTQPHARCIVSSTVTTDEQLVMYGGCAQNGGTGGPCPGRDTWRYDGAGGGGGGGGWRQCSTCPTPRTRGVMVPLLPSGGTADVRQRGRYVLLYGGYERDKQTISVSAAPDDEASVLDLGSGEWLMLRATGQVPAFRGQPAAAVDAASGRVWVFGGQLRQGGGLADDLYLLQGNPLDSPTSRSRCGRSFLYPHLHGIFMGLAWGVLLQAGWFIARYFKAHDPTWFHLHRGCQVSGLVLSVVGLAVVLAGGVKASNLGFSHGVIGLTALGLGLMQPANAFFRPHKGQPRRQQWEWLHLTTGRVAVALGAANVSLGTFLVQGPYAVWISWHVVLAVFLAAVVVMEVRHRRALRRQRAAAVSGGGMATHGSIESGDGMDGVAKLGVPVHVDGGGRA